MGRYFFVVPKEDPSMIRVSFRDNSTEMRVHEDFDTGPVAGWVAPQLETYRGSSQARPQDRLLYDRSFILLSGRPVFDEELANLLTPHLVTSQDGEYLPALLAGRQYALYNSWRVVEAYDDDLSQYHPSVIPGYKGFTRPVLLASRLRDNPAFFRLTKLGHSYIVNQTVYDLMISVGRLGQELVEVAVLDR